MKQKSTACPAADSRVQEGDNNKTLNHETLDNILGDSEILPAAELYKVTGNHAYATVAELLSNLVYGGQTATASG